jgi:tagatose-6-phosphate ketose/aldose isomerase
VASEHPVLDVLRTAPEAEQEARGYCKTLDDIIRQPSAWRHTLTRLAPVMDRVIARTPPADVSRRGALVITGSGSSHLVGESCRLSLQRALGIPVYSIAAGTLLTDSWSVPSADSLLVLSITRSGDSPESAAVINLLLHQHPAARHVVLTCSAEGRVATAYASNSRVLTCVLGDDASDRGVVASLSFTSLLIAARAVGFAERWPLYEQRVGNIAARVARLLTGESDQLARVAGEGFRSVIYLGSGDRLGAAREAALKMLEMTGGHVHTMAETYLGLRHGPVMAIHPDTLVVAFLSADPVARAFEIDLLEELAGGQMGPRTLVVGSSIPGRFARSLGAAIEVGDGSMDDGELVLIDAVVGQLLAFFTGLSRGIPVDRPASARGITRVVAPFRIHGPAGRVS